MAEEDLEAWSKNLREGWNARAATPEHRFYIASLPAWQHAEAWDRQAAVDVELMTALLEEDFLRRAHVLEIGCGIGRLVPHLAPRVASYTGVDVSSSMVAIAREEVGESDSVRFFESDGVSVPAEVAERQFDLVVAWAVFIHCPLPVIEELVRAGTARLSRDGVFRFQVRADLHDPKGITETPRVAALDEQIAAAEAAAPEGALTQGETYEGHGFGYDEFDEFLARLHGGPRALYRFDRANLFAELRAAE